MKLQIDNFDGRGPSDYTSAIDASRAPKVVRRLNKPDELQLSLIADRPDFIVPGNGARITLGRSNGEDVFTGYLTQAPAFEYLGWGERGPVYRYNLVAQGDEVLLDRKQIPNSPPFVDRSAGDALRQLTEDLLPGIFDTTAVQDVDTIAHYAPSPQKKWSEHAAEIALRARAVYRALNGALSFAPVGASVYALNETDASFSPESLTLQPADGLVNDLTVFGVIEPQAYVKDYFVGDNLSLKFYLSQIPFTRRNRTLVDEEYAGTSLDPTRWGVDDPLGVVSVNGGKLQVAGGTGIDGQTTVAFAEKIELGGALVLQHGNVTFSGQSDGILGGFYPAIVSLAGCLAGFRILPNGGQPEIQAVVNGTLSGTAMLTSSGHIYALTTRIYSAEVFRRQQTFHSASYPAGNGYGGTLASADVRIVLEVHDVDPTNPATAVAPSTVLYDSLISGAPGFCSYVLVNAANLNSSIAFTRILQAVDAEVRSALPNGTYRTRLVGSLSDGAECKILSSPALEFFPKYAPASGEFIEVRYRGFGRAVARVNNPQSIFQQAHGTDDGVRAAVRDVHAPSPRTASDCENAALALLDGAAPIVWSGEYTIWSDFLPGNASDIFPGDRLDVNIPSRSSPFEAIVSEVQIELRHLADDHSMYKLVFEDNRAAALAFAFQQSNAAPPMNLTEMTVAEVGSKFLSALKSAEVTAVTSTTTTIDAGTAPPSGGGIEVRWSDAGWGAGNDRNLVGRFSTRSFTVPRLDRTQSYYLRQYDNSTPPKYSRYTTALHVDYPL